MESVPYIFDFKNIFLGNFPPEVFFEIFIRVMIVYIYALVLLRLCGRRTKRKLSFSEVLIIVALGPTIGNAMFSTAEPLFHAIFIITVIVLFQNILSAVTRRSERMRRLLEGNSELIIKDGVILESVLQKSSYAREDLYSSLRRRGIRNINEVELAYIETNGELSVFRLKQPSFISDTPILPLT
ncbi:MAG: DUF421 domain-containing protein [Candidatus Gracilibacteria bacterium]